MIPQSKGKMYVAGERGITSLPWLLSHQTFNFSNYQQEHKTPFEQLYLLNDEVLAPTHSIMLTAEVNTTIALLPLIGAVNYKDSLGNESYVVAGALQLFNVTKGTSITLTNPYADEAVNFLQLWIKASHEQQYIVQPFEIDLDGNLNHLPVIAKSNGISIAVGKFEGRKEGVYSIAQEGNAVFAFVIDGQMEVQYRLLQSRDGLGLWDLNEIEFEALSASAILLMVEVPVIMV